MNRYILSITFSDGVTEVTGSMSKDPFASQEHTQTWVHLVLTHFSILSRTPSLNFQFVALNNKEHGPFLFLCPPSLFPFPSSTLDWMVSLKSPLAKTSYQIHPPKDGDLGHAGDAQQVWLIPLTQPVWLLAIYGFPVIFTSLYPGKIP